MSFALHLIFAEKFRWDNRVVEQAIARSTRRKDFWDRKYLVPASIWIWSLHSGAGHISGGRKTGLLGIPGREAGTPRQKPPFRDSRLIRLSDSGEQCRDTREPAAHL
jgi:hypothetical protein